MSSIPRVAPLRRLVREALMNGEQNTPTSDLLAAVAPSAQGLTARALPELDEQRRIWQSTDLLGGDAEALIVHRGQTYRLRCTKQGKLILYK
jgi:hemin uptake protein HemP